MCAPLSPSPAIAPSRVVCSPPRPAWRSSDLPLQLVGSPASNPHFLLLRKSVVHPLRPPPPPRRASESPGTRPSISRGHKAASLREDTQIEGQRRRGNASGCPPTPPSGTIGLPQLCQDPRITVAPKCRGLHVRRVAPSTSCKLLGLEHNQERSGSRTASIPRRPFDSVVSSPSAMSWGTW